MSSSQDPGYVPTPYTHDVGFDYQAPIPGAYSPMAAISNGQQAYLDNRQPASPLIHRQQAPYEARPDRKGEIVLTADCLPPESPGGRISNEYETSRHLSTDREAPTQQPHSSIRGAVLDPEVIEEGASAAHSRLLVRTASNFTNRERTLVLGGTFINGAGMVGPHTFTEPNEELQQRAHDANISLTPKQKAKIIKAEVKDNRRLSSIIKQEAKVEKKALDQAISELADLQKLQKQAVKEEAKAHTAYSKVLTAFKKQEAVYLTVKTRYETLQGQVSAEEERLEAIRESAKMVTERVAGKNQEVDGLRKMYSIDAREREVKLSELKEKKGLLWNN